MLILSDVHIGFDRKGGTTPASREKLRSYLMGSFAAFIDDHLDTDETLVILGDLFDAFEVSPRDWVDTFAALQKWLFGHTRKLVLVAGNHDHSPKALRVSSFEMLCTVLRNTYFDQVTIVGIDEWMYLSDDIVAVAHCSNQDTFNLKLAEVLGKVKMGDRVLLHANFDNKFAVESDHSLNVSYDLAKEFAAKGATLYFAHEHQARTALGGSVVVFGNQWPTSIADCLNNDEKFAHVMTGGVQKVQTWKRDGIVASYREWDWRELTESNADFVKVTGQATSTEASEVINKLADFRKRSEAFIVTNAVKIEGVAEVESLPETFEAAKAFDVMEFIARHLNQDQMMAVNKLLEKV